MNLIVLASLLGRGALGVYLVTRKSSVAKGFGILALGSVAVSGAALLELKRRGIDLTARGSSPSLPKTPLAGYFGYAG